MLVSERFSALVRSTYAPLSPLQHPEKKTTAEEITLKTAQNKITTIILYQPTNKTCKVSYARSRFAFNSNYFRQQDFMKSLIC